MPELIRHLISEFIFPNLGCVNNQIRVKMNSYILKMHEFWRKIHKFLVNFLFFLAVFVLPIHFLNKAPENALILSK
jgi:hypothetical protein